MSAPDEARNPTRSGMGSVTRTFNEIAKAIIERSRRDRESDD